MPTAKDLHMKKILAVFSFFSFLLVQIMSSSEINASELSYFQKEKYFAEVNNVLPTIEGWCWDEKATYLMDLIFETKPVVCVEIGVFGGSSAFPMAYALKVNQKGVLYAVDAWTNEECTRYLDPNDPNYKWWNSLNLDAIYQSFLNVVDKFSLSPFVQVVKKTSSDAAMEIPDNIDILHIDGNHSSEASLNDVMTYLPKVREGGYIVFNCPFAFGNHKASQYLCDNFEFEEIITNKGKDSCMVLRKIPLED